MTNVDEASLSEVTLELGTGLGITAHLMSSLEKGVNPNQRFVVLGQSSVLGVVLQIEILKLCPTSGRQGAAVRKYVS